MSKNEWIKDRLHSLDDDAFIEIVDELAERASKTVVKHNDELVSIIELEEEIDDVYKNWGKPSGLSTGYPLLDEKIGGLKRGEVTLIGGLPPRGHIQPHGLRQFRAGLVRRGARRHHVHRGS